MSLAEPVARDSSSNDGLQSASYDQLAGLPGFTEVYNQYFDFVWACTRRMGVRDSELDDVVQDVFIVIHAKLATVEKPGSLRSWVYGIIRRTAFAYHRARRTKVTSTEALNTEPEMRYPQPPSPLELTEQTEQVKLLWALLEKLEPTKREVLVLAELDEMTAPEIAIAIEVPLNTVYSRIRSARQELEVVLARHHAQTGQRGRP